VHPLRDGAELLKRLLACLFDVACDFVLRSLHFSAHLRCDEAFGDRARERPLARSREALHHPQGLSIARCPAKVASEQSRADARTRTGDPFITRVGVGAFANTAAADYVGLRLCVLLSRCLREENTCKTDDFLSRHERPSTLLRVRRDQ
jgi:hypothetical protein